MSEYDDDEEMTEAEKRAEDLDATSDFKSNIDFCRGPLSDVADARHMAEIIYEKSDPELARRIREDFMGLTLREVSHILDGIFVPLGLVKAAAVLRFYANERGHGGEGA
ncbi:MAG: hypothetical protein LKI67_04450 [Olsenella sp.]|nr:hypothetical protein [Olsenella sp.]MCI1792907.1 hypothetical protein [Olsenella sp.]MCI1811090.1 hypothetical protein [Olsenella sp.]MCI1878700.1 hypothetical protein [Olsenella sp.]